MGDKTGILLKISLLAAGLFACCFLFNCSGKVDYTPPPNSSDMAITHYSFGEMTVDGESYEHDIAIGPNGTVSAWKTKISHYVQLSDVEHLLDDSTRILVIGIGAHKRCKVSDDLVAFAKSKGVEIFILSTYSAVKRFNASPKTGLSACFHLNC